MVVASSIEAQRETVSTVAEYLLIGYPLLLLLVGRRPGYWSDGRFGRSSGSRARVHGIGAEHLSERVPVPPTQDEIARLAVTDERDARSSADRSGDPAAFRRGRQR